MGNRDTEFQERRDRILGIVVGKYINTVAPVSSNYIAQEHHLDLSPATIRNILAELEEQGYLTHPHTSAGRIPTQLGYRYYVDNLMNEIQLLEEEKKRIQLEYTRDVAQLESLLEKTSEVISDLTHYTTIVTLDGSSDKIYYHGASFVVEYPDLQDFRKIKEILQILEEKERLFDLINRNLHKKIEIFIGQELACEQVNGCSLALTRFKKHNGPSGRIGVLGPTSMNYEKVFSTLDYISKMMNEIL